MGRVFTAKNKKNNISNIGNTSNNFKSNDDIPSTFFPNTFSEFWSAVKENLKKSNTDSNHHLNKDRYNRIRLELLPIAKDLWVLNKDKRERFYKVEKARANS